MKVALFGLIIFMTVGVTISREFLERFGVETNYLLIGLGAAVITGLLIYRGLALVILVCLMSLSVNLPSDFLAQYYIDKEVMLGVLAAMVMLPMLYQGVSTRNRKA